MTAARRLTEALERVGGFGRAADTALRTAERRGLSPLRALLAAGIPLPALQEATWEAHGCPRIELDPGRLDTDAMASLPVAVSRRIRGVAIGASGPRLTVAVVDPLDISVNDQLRRALGASASVDLVAADAEAIDEALRRYEAAEMLGSASSDPALDARHEPARPIALTTPGEGDSHAARQVAAMVTYAVRAHASDVHVSCDDTGAEVRVRIDGVLHHHTRINGVGAAASLVSRIKVLGGLDLGQRRLPQDGRIQADLDGRAVDIRLATIPNVWDAEDAVLRILDSTVARDGLDSLGLGRAVLAAWSRLWQSPYGLVLVAGPTGVGKSTTLYATLRNIATPDRAVRTVEDPVEVRIPCVTQVQVNPKAGLTFASALRSFLRADPDVILVGEIRDHETARVATDAAVTGHLVLATVHTSTAFQVPIRLIEMGVPTYLVSAALRGAMAQRLVRRLCHDCKVEDSDATFRASEKGCARCAFTGYKGRLAAGEVLVADDAIRQAISAGAPADQIETLAIGAGTVRLRDAILDLVRRGETSIVEMGRIMTGGEG